MGLNLEIKPCPGREKETAEVALDLLSTIWDDHDHLLISSFFACVDGGCVGYGERLASRVLLPDHTQEEWAENWVEMVEYLQASSIHLNGNTVTRDLVDSVIDQELPVLAYTINNPDRARFLQSWGVDGFLVMCPMCCRRVFFGCIEVVYAKSARKSP